jgi:hypothetical protein
MRQKTQHSYLCLTLFEQDIKELVRLFQTHLQDAEIVIDNHHMLDKIQFEQYITHLEQSDPTYQVRSLIAHGHYHEKREEQEQRQVDPPSIELSMSKRIATLSVWKETDEGEPTMVADVRKLLLGHVNRVYQFLFMCSFLFTYLAAASSLMSSAQRHRLDFSNGILLVVGGGIPIGVATCILLTVILHFLQLDTRVFLFPGEMKPRRVYGRRETIGTLVVALILFVLIPTIVASVLRVLWR